jgi:hypothetical protein
MCGGGDAGWRVIRLTGSREAKALNVQAVARSEVQTGDPLEIEIAREALV